MEPLDEQAARLPVRELSPEEVEALAERVLLASRRRSRVPVTALALAALLLLAVGAWLLAPAEPAVAPAPAAVALGEALDHVDHIDPVDDARYAVSGPVADRVVALEHGTIDVTVEPRARGERFRVVLDDAFVEVVGTHFTVSAHHGLLEEVQVSEGVVEVHLPARVLELRAGQRWPAPDDSAPAPAPAPAPAVEPPAPPPEIPEPTKPSVPAPPLARGLRHLDRGAFPQALEAFAEQDGPLAEDAAFWTAVTLLRAEREEEAIEALRSYVAAYPTGDRIGEAWCWLGRLTGERHYFESAATSSVDEVRACGEQGLAAL